MNRRNGFSELVRATRQESPPPIDVVSSVLATVRARQARPTEPVAFVPAWTAAVAAVVALLMLIPASQSFLALYNPMTALFGTLRAGL